MPDPSPSPSVFPPEGGACGERLAGLDWSAHPLGPPHAWPGPLRTAVDIILSSRFPMMVHWGPELFTFYNDAYAPGLGGKHPGHLGQPAREWWSEIWDQLTPIFERVAAGETVHVEDARYTPDRGDGPAEAYFTHCHSPIRGATGEVEGVFLVVTETTSRVLAERGRRIEEVRNRQIVDSATDFAIIATDLDARVTRWNAGAERLFGWTERQMCGEGVDRISTPEDLAGGRPAVQMDHALTEGRGADERWRLRASGERFWAQGEMTPLRDEAGAVAGFVEVLRDRTAERLRERRLALLAEASGRLLDAGDPTSVIDAVLTAGAGALGFDQSHLFELTSDGRRLRLTHGIGVPEDAWAALCDGESQDTLCAIVVETRRPLVLSRLQEDPTPRHAAARGRGLRAYAGFPIAGRDALFGVISFGSFQQDAFDEESLDFFKTLARFLSVGRERLQAEGALRDLAMTLEHKVEERTRELLASEEALRHSQKMDAVGQLTGGVAHDFNNLLTVILGAVDILRRENVPPEKRRRYVEAIGDTAARAARLTGQLLAFARRQTLKPEVFDVNARLADVGQMLDSVTGQRVRVRTTPAPEEPCVVRADVSQFETALVNMAVNARDAMDGEGELTIAVRCGAVMPAIRGHASAPGPFVAVSLADTGGGIAPEDMARIFEPFFTTKAVGKGTGLGLSQVFGFAKQSGGDVDVRSEPGRGTTFTLYLPAAGPEAKVEAPGPAAVVSTEGRGVRVLVVEDNVDVGRFSTQALEDFGYDTVWVASAEEALERLGPDGSGFDVVFSDVVMPGMGGVELARRLAAALPDMPVVLASGYSHVLAQEGAPGVELLQKPYSADQLSRVLQRVAAASRGGPRGAKAPSAASARPAVDADVGTPD